MQYAIGQIVIAPATLDNIDENADGNTYFGTAAPGTVTSAPAWQIMRMSTSGTNKTFKYANGDSGFSAVWDNRTSLTYL